MAAPRRVALFAPDYLDYVHRLADGVLDYQAEHGGFVLSDLRFHLGDLDDAARRGTTPPWAGQADGVIAYVGPQPGLDAWIARGGVPVVNTTADRSGSGLPAVHCDAASLARSAVDHFLGLGLTEFAHVGHAASAGSAYRERALVAELERRGLGLRAWRLEAALDGSMADVSGLLASDPEFGALLREAPKPLAVLALSDSYAAATVRVCRRVGLAVPHEVAVLGVGDTAFARDCDPPLSSIRPPGERVGYEAMRLLDGLMAGTARPAGSIEIPAEEVVVRESTVAEPVRDADIDRALRMIRERACRGLTVEDVLRTLHVSRKTFERRFLEATGRAPGEEIRRIRLERAKELLAATDLSVTRIGRMVGLPHGSMFTRFFKDRTGLTPRDYRRAVRRKPHDAA